MLRFQSGSQLILSVLFVLCCLVLGFGILRGENGIENFLALRKSREILAKTVADIENENARLAEEINKLKKSPTYAKKVMRDKYHLTEPNENIIFFSDQ